MTGNDIPRDEAGRVRRPKPSQLLADVMDALGPDHITTRTLMAALIERDAAIGVEPRAVTPVYGWHVPVLSDPPNVPYDMQELALDIEGTDTGWRNVASSLANGWTATAPPLVRRIGRTVHLRLPDVTRPATFNAALFSAVPSGFGIGPSAYTYSPLHVLTTAATLTNAYATLTSSSWVSISGTAPAPGARLRMAFVYVTDDPWPTTLPGTPALLGVLPMPAEGEVG